MIIVMKSGVTEADVEEVCRRVVELGYQPHTIHGEIKTVIAAVGEERGQADLRILEALETVEAVMPVQQPFKLASRETKSQPSEVPVNGISIGGKQLVVMAGPCSVESQ
ncbi:MAG: 3-deoxy-7-phosphoheptulonate synthase, 3-deoxy-7-phosphoheptulonate synthase, partial [Candidatus Rokubacteria bacterium CSP1-6]